MLYKKIMCTACVMLSYHIHCTLLNVSKPFYETCIQSLGTLLTVGANCFSNQLRCLIMPMKICSSNGNINVIKYC